MFPLILLYVFLTIVRPQEYIPALIGLPVLPVVLVLAFAAWIASGARRPHAPQFLILLAFFGVLMLSEVANGWVGGVKDQLGKFGPVVLIFFMIASACTTQPRIRTLMAVMVMCSTLLAIHGIGQHRTGIGWTGIPLAEDGRIRYAGIFDDPNDLGMLFVSVFPMGCLLFKRAGFIGKPFWLVCILTVLYGVYLTNSRGAMLGVLVVIGAYIWYRRGMVVAAILGAAGLAVMKMLSSRMQELDAGEESASGRVDAWYEGLQMFKSHPLFGVGPGNFTDYNPLTAHNSFVLVLAETGFVGYVLWLALIGYTFWMVATVLRQKPDAITEPERYAAWSEERPMALTLLLSLCGMFACAFFLSRSYMIVLYVVLAIVTGFYVGARERIDSLPSFSMTESGMRWIPAAIGSIAGLFVLVSILLRTEG
ncbi:O-antigen ligase family protein [Dyella telluris]|uniref:O-antigen ligase family protein n=1 Tax=Dyella telluris TaxID=2763498 RepID=A0A7G8Q4B6_9GAMM|nr:O-antigen ligase family protein [Dyella telluris]QNK01624.1 O-antigen ligase family protein [Dyella telluris]